jgi:hypothetical protein
LLRFEPFDITETISNFYSKLFVFSSTLISLSIITYCLLCENSKHLSKQLKRKWVNIGREKYKTNKNHNLLLAPLFTLTISNQASILSPVCSIKSFRYYCGKSHFWLSDFPTRRCSFSLFALRRQFTSTLDTLAAYYFIPYHSQLFLPLNFHACSTFTAIDFRQRPPAWLD